MGTKGDGKAIKDELTRIEREIAACERAFYGDGPLWIYLLGSADWQIEKRMLLQQIETEATT